MFHRGVPAGSHVRSILQAACSKFAQVAVKEDLQRQAKDMQLACSKLVALIADRLAIQDSQVGSDLDELKPPRPSLEESMGSAGVAALLASPPAPPEAAPGSGAQPQARW